MKTMQRRATAVFSFAMSFAFAPAASAGDDAHHKAGESFRQARDAFARKDFAAAAAAFEQAAQFESHPAPLLNAADAWERAGAPERAAADCDAVLRMSGLEESFRAEAERLLARVTPRVGTVELRGPSTVAARVDGSPEVTLPADVRVAPGLHVVALLDRTSGRGQRVELAVEAGATRTVDGAFPALEAPARAPVSPGGPPAPIRRRPIPAATWIGLGVGAAAAAVASTFGVLTVIAKDDYDALPTESSYDAFHRNRAVTNVSWAIAGAAGVVALGWFLATRGGAPAGGRARAFTFHVAF